MKQEDVKRGGMQDVQLASGDVAVSFGFEVNSSEVAIHCLFVPRSSNAGQAGMQESSPIVAHPTKLHRLCICNRSWPLKGAAQAAVQAFRQNSARNSSTAY